MHDLGVTRGTRVQQLHQAWPGPAHSHVLVSMASSLCKQNASFSGRGKGKKKTVSNQETATLLLEHHLYYFAQFEFFCFAGNGHRTTAFPPLCLEWECQPMGCPRFPWHLSSSSKPTNALRKGLEQNTHLLL